MKGALFVLAACFAGSFLSLQGAINTQLSKFVGGSVFAAFISFFIGTVALFTVLLIRGDISINLLPNAISAPAWLYIGGALGALYVTVTIMLLPRIGVTTTVLSVVCGQIMMSLLLDHIGAFGMPVRPLTLLRIGGAALVILGLTLVFIPNVQR